MKRMLLTAFLFAGFIANSQTSVYHPFPGVNSHWNFTYSFYCWTGVPSWNGYSYSIRVSSDTLIGATTYHKLYTPYIKTDSSGCTSASVTTNIYRGSIREDTAAKKVFYVQPAFSTEKLLYDFNLAVGDTVFGALQASGPKDTVISIDSVQLSNGNYVKRWFINSCYNIYIIEGVGCTYGLFNTSPGCGPDWPDIGLNCMNAGAYLYPNITDCDLLNSVSGIRDQKDVSIFPNPSKGSFNIDFGNERFEELMILDQLGKVIVAESVQNKNGYSVHELNAGVYTVHLTNKDHLPVCKKIVKVAR